MEMSSKCQLIGELAIELHGRSMGLS